MKRIKQLFFGFLVISLLAVAGCTKKIDDKSADKYKYAVILSEQLRNGVLQLYDADGNYLESKKLEASGIDENGSAYLNGPQFLNEKWYIGVSSDYKMQDFILELDPKTLETKEIPANIGEQYQYTGFAVEEDYLYTFYSTPVKGSHIIKSKLSNGEKVDEIYIENSILLHIIPNNNNLILISDNSSSPEMHIRIANKDTLEVEKEYKNTDYLFVSDVQLIDDKLYMSPQLDESDSLVDQLLIFDIKNENWATVQLPFNNVRYLKPFDNKLYIVEQDLESNKHSIAILDLKTQEVENTIRFNHIAREVIISNNSLISSSSDKVYEYDLKTLKLKNEFKIDEANKRMFGSLLTKP